ncbi:MAG: DEAD/DEAH box helicase [Saccharopolyspora sp.]|uniref:DEAD/DEAH box helicase n=1 Tax=Saccharopolyspora TaxID=1835 RepID=UPI00190BF135|nr:MULTISPECIES: DEAD/DEAH box helicase [unclassified Saccharopolyspora]MBK0868573.1 DEAD/DEAH box helicase [Saccharopolyspora sp. HNM0986]MBQ6642716.1 DEAD/DEAH box helicase [Saccharopolyspora sp.]
MSESQLDHPVRSVLSDPADTAGRPLRAWQRRALTRYLAKKPRDFMAVATPGAGKTTFGLRVAAELLGDRTVEAVTVITPTEHLKHQWALAANAAGIPLDPDFRNGDGMTSSDYVGVAVTYAQIAAHPTLHRVRTERRKTLVILDEIHHAGDAKSWGDAVREACTPATRRLGLTGTPFRSDDTPIPFVNYEPDADGSMRSAADSSYGYSEALQDGVVRPVIFLAYSGETRWRTNAGDEFSARLGEPLTAEQTARAWRTALDPAGEWIPSVLRAADTRLNQLRQNGMPDAGGLIIASDQASAKAYAKTLQRMTGEEPVVVLSDDPKASGRIAEFADSDDRWMIAVRMVSEGVDVPRLAVGVYATSASTPLFFAQAVGRFVRARREGETASIFLPSVPVLLGLASELEAERDHVLGKPHREKEGWDEELLAEANRTKDEPGEEEKAFTSLGADAELDQVIYDGSSFGTAAFGTTEDEQDYLGLPGLLEPDQVRALLRQRQEQQLHEVGKREAEDKAQKAAERAEEAKQPSRPQSVQERLQGLRKELNTLVSLHHHRTRKPHGKIHNELRRVCGGPPTAMATVEQLEERIATLRSW